MRRRSRGNWQKRPAGIEAASAGAARFGPALALARPALSPALARRREREKKWLRHPLPSALVISHIVQCPEFVGESEGESVSVFEFVFEGGLGERARSGTGWRSWSSSRDHAEFAT